MLLGCEQSFLSNSAQLHSFQQGMGWSPPPSGPVAPEDPEDETPADFELSICSELNFDHVTWPKGMDEEEVNAYALAMNISGSFEGHDGWSNIANNFDGQGISLGLFNQNLGQGSLQPLLNGYRSAHPNLFLSHFTASQAQSLQQMLNTWGTAQINPLAKLQVQQNQWERDTSDLDDPLLITQSTLNVSSKASNTQNQHSVDWAVANLYSGTQFKTAWRTALQDLAEQPEYVTYQVAAATAIHKKAMGYMESYGFRELSSYLFFFDIVVQNGGIQSSVQTEYLTWLRSNPSATEITKAKRLLEFRLKLVRSEYVADVRSRKLSILNGTGTVHGSVRNYAREYCGPDFRMLLL